MSNVTKPILLDETGQLMATYMAEQTKLLKVIAGSSISSSMSLDAIHRIVTEGAASEVFSIGDQIMIKWKDKENNNTEYDVPLDIVHFGDVELQDGEIVPGMFLQWHYCSPFGVQFDAREAFYVVPAGGMAAGDYTFNVPTTWGKITAGDYTFSVDTDLPEGTQLYFNAAYVDVNTGLVGAIIKAYATPTSTEATGTYTIASGDTGTSLGQLKAAGDTNLNSIQCANYGFNDWGASGIRQFLNSGEAKTAWWTAQHKYDRPPSELATKAGFLTGFDDEFLATIKSVKVCTSKNTVNQDGSMTTTYDKIFLPALQQMHVTAQVEGEGDVWEYWKRVSGRSTPCGTGSSNVYPQMRTFAIENHSSAQNVRLRSAYRGYAYNTWNEYSFGYFGGSGATNSYRFAPACVMC